MKIGREFFLAANLAFVLLGFGSRAVATVGAVTPFTTYEAEAGTLGGGAAVVSLTAAPTPVSSSPALEASGRAYVQLTGAGQSVTWTNTTSTSITALNLRFSIPDASGGGGTTATLDLYVNGAFRQAISLSSAQAWVYETSAGQDGMSQNPSSGYPHVFFEETHAFISGAAVAPGSTITLKQDAANTAAFYWIDLIDLEAPPAPLAQPANSLSITSYGAVANNNAFDNTAAIQACINAAQTQGKAVWIPQGTFYITTANDNLTATGITISGAGEWYSVLYHKLALPTTASSAILNCQGCTVKNLLLDSNMDARGEGSGTSVNMGGSNWLIDSVWSQHGILTWASGVNGTVQNCRVNNSWGDGINLNNGGGVPTSGLTAQNNFIRGCGDDGIAINAGWGGQMYNTTVTGNTSVCSYWANNLRVAGGANDVVTNNLGCDPVKGRNMVMGTFSAAGAAVESVLAQGNTLVRGGSDPSSPFPAVSIGGSLTPPTVSNVSFISNTIEHSLFGGIEVSSVSNCVLQGNTIDDPATYAITYEPGAIGSGVMNDNAVTNLAAGVPRIYQLSPLFEVNSPQQAASFNAASTPITTQACSEGATNVGYVTNGSYTVYNNVDLSAASAFVARVASAGAGGNIVLHLDSATGTVVGTCAVPATGGWQAWSNVSCLLSGAGGFHNLYLVYTGGSSYLFNLEWFTFYHANNVIEASDFDGQSGTIQTQSDSEGTLNVDYITNGTYTYYNSVPLDNISTLYFRVASAGGGGSIQVRLDSPTGTLIGTCPVTSTGGWQTWTTQSCAITATTGTHVLYLVYAGGSGNLFNLEYFTPSLPFPAQSIGAAGYNVASGSVTTQACSEGGLNLDYITNGSYTVYNAVNMNSLSSLSARVAASGGGGNTGGSIQIRLDSPTGTLIGTCSAPVTGGWQTWATQTCSLTPTTGCHNLYLVYAGGSGNLFNLENFQLDY